jgi:secondary thiamine-phosphate synthase enzyme
MKAVLLKISRMRLNVLLRRIYYTGIMPDGGDGNGYSHVRAALLGPSLTILVIDGRLTLGTWQQIILLDFDNRPRQRQIIGQVFGSK